MLDHASITVSDLARAVPFRDGEMIGHGIRNRPGSDGRTDLSVRVSRSVLVADDRHGCVRVPGRAAVDAFHAASLATAGRCDGPPGLRPDDHSAYRTAFLLAPDGNRAGAVRHHA